MLSSVERLKPLAPTIAIYIQDIGKIDAEPKGEDEIRGTSGKDLDIVFPVKE
jgi:hypothetical protein